MKYIAIIITTILIAITTIPKSEYQVTAEFSDTPQVEKVVSDTPFEVEVSPASSSSEVSEYKPHVTEALAQIPNDEEWEVIASKEHATIIAQIYKGESNFGRHDVCRSKGKFNGFGFGESVTRLQTVGAYCYDSFDALVTDIDNWIEARIQEGFNANEINCYYVKGIRTTQCDTSYKLAQTK